MEALLQTDESLREHLASALPVLGVMSTQLKETATQIESSVVEICGKFQSMAERARSGVTGAAEILTGAGKGNVPGSVDGLIAEASQTIETLLRQTQDSAAVSASAIERIERVRAATDQISHSLTRLDDITVGNRLLAVNARIQAVHAGDKASGFAGVANEIASQARLSSEIVELIRDVSLELKKVADLAVADLQRMSAEDQKAYRKSKQDVDRVLGDFRSMHRSTQEFIERMTEESAQVAKEIFGAVRSLQFQDRINQRIGHVVAELDRIRLDLAGSCPGIELNSRPILDRLADSYTMKEERAVLGVGQGEVGSEVSEGDVELF